MTRFVVGRWSLVVAVACWTAVASAADPPPCKTGTARQTVTLALSDSGAQLPVSVVARVTYDRALARPLEPLRAQVKALAAGAMLVPSLSDTGLRLVAGKGGGLPAGPLADIELARCSGARAATVADFHCTVESCAGSGGAMSDCTCSVTLR